MKHELKIEQHYLDQLLSGEKTFEIRLNDRSYQKGDTLRFCDSHCFPSNLNGWKHNDHNFEITYVHSGLGLAPNYVVLAIRKAGGE